MGHAIDDIKKRSKSLRISCSLLSRDMTTEWHIYLAWNAT
jgi:hypothetical protein